VDDAGEVRVYYVNSLDTRPICFSDSISAWGLAFGGESYLLAVSANSHAITLIDTKARSQGTRDQAPRVITGHEHNIPCVDFSPCGRFLVSASIDETCALWNTETGEMIKSCEVTNEWGWGVLFVDPRSVRDYPSEDEALKVPPRQSLLKLRKDAGLSPYSYAGPSSSFIRQLFRGRFQIPESDDEDEEAVEEEEGSQEPATPMDVETSDGEEELVDVGEGDFDAPEEEHELDAEFGFDLYQEIEAARQSQHQPLQSTLSPQPRPAASSRVPPKTAMPSQFVVFASQHHIFLLDGNLKTLAKLENPISIDLAEANSELYGYDRLSLMRYVPEFSVLILASQGTGRAIFLRLARSENAGKTTYHIIPLSIFPPAAPQRRTPLVGMDIRRNMVKGRLVSVDLVMIYQQGHIATCEISRPSGRSVESLDSLLI